MYKGYENEQTYLFNLHYGDHFLTQLNEGVKVNVREFVEHLKSETECPFSKENLDKVNCSQIQDEYDIDQWVPEFDNKLDELKYKLKRIEQQLNKSIDLFHQAGGMDETIIKYKRDRIAFVAVIHFIEGYPHLLNSFPGAK